MKTVYTVTFQNCLPKIFSNFKKAINHCRKTYNHPNAKFQGEYFLLTSDDFIKSNINKNKNAIIWIPQSNNIDECWVEMRAVNVE